MAYGSWSGGIFLLGIDEETGYPVHPEEDEAWGIDPYFTRHLAGGWHNSVEGPYIIYDRESGYYYLFLSYGTLTSDGGYQIRLFRSAPPPRRPLQGQKGGKAGILAPQREWRLRRDRAGESPYQGSPL